MRVCMKSEKMDWRTPEAFLALVRKVGPIAYDPASQPDNPTRAKRYSYQAGGNPPCGLSADWRAIAGDGLVFCNPPYGRHLGGPVEPDAVLTYKGAPVGQGRGWAVKMASHDGEGVYLVPSRTETRWWGRLYDSADWACLWSSPTLGPRLRFARPGGGEADVAPFPSTVFYKGPNAALFLEAFGPHGRVIPGGRMRARIYDALLHAV